MNKRDLSEAAHDIFKNQKRHLNCLRRRFGFLLGTPKRSSKEFGDPRMYTFESPILYSEEPLRGAFSGQHPR